MSAYKEIVTKAVVGKGKKYYKNTYTIDVGTPVSTVLGAWIINHKFSGKEIGKKIEIDGSFDVNLWYSYDDDTKTSVVKKNILIIMISHDLNIAAKYSDTMIMLNGGYIYAIGTPSEVITKENIKAVYGVDSEIIQSHGRPHLIMLDEEFDDKCVDLPPDTYACKEKKSI